MGVSTMYERGVLAEEITVPGDGCSPEVIQTSELGGIGESVRTP